MTVEDLIEELRLLPPTAVVVVRIRTNQGFDGRIEPLYEWRSAAIESAIYTRGKAHLELEE
jgi:hypothetical protein